MKIRRGRHNEFLNATIKVQEIIYDSYHEKIYPGEVFIADSDKVADFIKTKWRTRGIVPLEGREKDVVFDEGLKHWVNFINIDLGRIEEENDNRLNNPQGKMRALKLSEKQAENQKIARKITTLREKGIIGKDKKKEKLTGEKLFLAAFKDFNGEKWKAPEYGSPGDAVMSVPGDGQFKEFLDDGVAENFVKDAPIPNQARVANV